jgi:hypothetical protein
MSAWNKSKSKHTKVDDEQISIILEKNKLDVELYRFAIDLFEKRLNIFRSKMIT